ncbi:MAG: 2-dehydro-3-deoxygalactonokinase [Gemmatimonadaceae bacterium]
MTSRARLADDAARLIALDWGTSALRAYLLGDDGVVLDERSEPWGIMQLPEGEFVAAFREVTGRWLAAAPELRALASGMVGSAQGWVEAPYCAAPAGVRELARSLVSVADEPLSIVPGVSQSGERPDVMRGEETQIVGVVERHPELAKDSLLVLPGTHSKWVHVREGRAERLTTFLTGELFAVLSTSSILGRFARDAANPPDAAAATDAFARGVLAARASAAGVTPLLFSVRALVLAGKLAAESSLEYLSGLLVGDELRCGLAAGEVPRALVGDAVLCARYTAAFGLFGIHGVPMVEHTAPAGLWAIAVHANLIRPTPRRVVA